MRMQLAVGQDASGDWARKVSRAMTPGNTFSVDVRMGTTTTRLIHGYLTLSRLNFSPDIHDSRFEITGMDALERVKRNSFNGQRKGDLSTVVGQILGDHLPLTLPPSTGPAEQISEAQSGTSLDFLAQLGAKNNREIYVESTTTGDRAFFQKLDFNGTAAISTNLRVNQGLQTNVRNAQFHFDLSGPTRVEANSLDGNGKSSKQSVTSDLRSIPTLSALETAMLGDPSFAIVTRLGRAIPAPPSLQTQCDSELEKHAWVVVGSGELDTAAYGDILYPRRTVQVMGSGSLFEGTFMVWKVTHSFSRDTHCQKFELRRRLGMALNGGN
jgi:hypothetical protein